MHYANIILHMAFGINVNVGATMKKKNKNVKIVYMKIACKHIINARESKVPKLEEIEYEL